MNPSGSLAKLEKGLALVMFWLLFLLAVDIGFRVILSLTGDLRGKGPPKIEDPRFESAPYRDATYDAEAFFAWYEGAFLGDLAG